MKIWDLGCIKHDFPCREDKHGLCRPQCVLCGELLAAESMKLSKFKRHLQTKHSSHKDKPVWGFQKKATGSGPVSKLDQRRVYCSGANASRASPKLAHRIAKCKKAHTISEDLVLPSVNLPSFEKKSPSPVTSYEGECEMCPRTSSIKANYCYALQLEWSADMCDCTVLILRHLPKWYHTLRFPIDFHSLWFQLSSC